MPCFVDPGSQGPLGPGTLSVELDREKGEVREECQEESWSEERVEGRKAEEPEGTPAQKP